MYYMKKYEEGTIHIHLKSDGVYIKNRQGTMLTSLDDPRTIRQTEQLFNARFQTVTNNDGSKTKIFM